METNLLDRMLSTYLNERTSVTVTLQNKIRVTGTIRTFDSYVIIMDGQKKEILYRHAVSSVAPSAAEERKRQTVPARPAAAKPAIKHKSGSQKHRTPQPTQQPLQASMSGSRINTGMKDGLLKWMQEQKAAK